MWPYSRKFARLIGCLVVIGAIVNPAIFAYATYPLRGGMIIAALVCLLGLVAGVGVWSMGNRR